MRMAVCVCAVGDEERCQRHSEPKLTFPPDWEDEERMHFLMGPFSPTTLTSLSLKDQKVQFWISLVRDACRLFRQPVFSGQQMAQRLRWRGQPPSCLPHVLQLMEQTGQLRPLWEGGERSVDGWLTWGVSVISSPIKWVWHSYLSPSNPAMADKMYIDTQLIKEMADTVLQQLQSRIEFRSTDQLVTRAQLKAVAMELVETSSVLAVENELVSQGMLSFRTSSLGLQVVKFAAAGENGPVCVSDVDEGILSLKENVTTLQTHVSYLEDRVRRLKRKARGYLQLKQQQLAVSCVRRGREVQQLLSSKTTMLNNLQHILHQIQMAESDVMVLDAYRKGTEVLKAIHRSGLSVAEAEKAVEELCEAVQVSDDVGVVLGEGVVQECVVGEDDHELERELQDILLSISSEGSHEEAPVDNLAGQLSQLQLIAPSGRDPETTYQQKSVLTASGEEQTERHGSHSTSGKHCQPQLT